MKGRTPDTAWRGLPSNDDAVNVGETTAPAVSKRQLLDRAAVATKQPRSLSTMTRNA